MTPLTFVNTENRKSQCSIQYCIYKSWAEMQMSKFKHDLCSVGNGTIKSVTQCCACQRCSSLCFGQVGQYSSLDQPVTDRVWSGLLARVFVKPSYWCLWSAWSRSPLHACKTLFWDTIWRLVSTNSGDQGTCTSQTISSASLQCCPVSDHQDDWCILCWLLAMPEPAWHPGISSKSLQTCPGKNTFARKLLCGLWLFTRADWAEASALQHKEVQHCIQRARHWNRLARHLQQARDSRTPHQYGISCMSMQRKEGAPLQGHAQQYFLHRIGSRLVVSNWSSGRHPGHGSNGQTAKSAEILEQYGRGFPIGDAKIQDATVGIEQLPGASDAIARRGHVYNSGYQVSI